MKGKVLVDTSVWVDHFKHSNEELKRVLVQDLVLCHPYVIGELACGTPPSPRERTLSALKLISHAKPATADEILFFIEKNKLYGKGCGFIDMALLASTLLTPNTLLWTLDKRLDQLALSLDVQYSPG